MSAASEQAIQNSKQFLSAAKERGYQLFTGVPCSLLTAIYKVLEDDKNFDYLPAVREDLAVGLAAGAYLGGKKSMVLIQNSGLGVCYNALASLNEIYQIPTFIVASWRGQGGKDAPEHLRMGEVMTKIFEELEIPYLVANPEKLVEQLKELDDKATQTKRPVALIAPKNVFV